MLHLNLLYFKRSLIFGLCTFAGQILAQSATGFMILSPKVQALAEEATAKLISSPSAIAWISFYFLLGVTTHALPFALAMKIGNDLCQCSSRRVRLIASERGFTLMVALLFLATMAAWSRLLFPKHFVIADNSTLGQVASMAPVVLASLASFAIISLWLAAAASRRSVALSILLPCTWLIAAQTPYAAPTPRQDDRPDIILLGVDSLRGDHLPVNGGPAHNTPTINDFVANSVYFDQAFTPMGRTFVAYMSILSGQYPTNHGVRENLWPRAEYRRDGLLPRILKDHGYTTIFGLDEVRFANIDEEFGFDALVTPPAGVIELVAGTLMDSFGTNLLQLVPGMDRLLPHVTGNRALIDSYQPSLQNRKLERAIHAASSDQPLFLATHFCIAHVPFANGKWHADQLPHPFQDSPAEYRKALGIADKQIKDVLDSLHNAGRLNNAVVVLLADHGEGLGMQKDRLVVQGEKFSFPADYGHGTVALQDSQSRVVLAMQRFVKGEAAWTSKRDSASASLVDIAPTILALVNIQGHGRTFDGVPLIDDSGRVLAPKERAIFVESGIFGRSIQTLNPNNNEVADEFGHLYHVVDDLRFELVPEEIPELLKNKQRGMVLGRYGVSALPPTRGRKCWVLVDYQEKTRTCIEDPREHPVTASYYPEICRHFERDTDFHTTWCDVELPKDIQLKNTGN